LFTWGEVMCGLMADVSPDTDPQLEEQRQEARHKIMDKRLEHWDLGLGSGLGIKVELS
jgi:hypothetical protein